MFGLRLLSESQNLRKNGQPPHSTSGVARTSSRYCGNLKYIEARSGALSTALTQNLRVMSRSSVLSSSAPATGTSAMPHFGHEPGPDWTTSGCIGQVYCDAGVFGFLAMCAGIITFCVC